MTAADAGQVRTIVREELAAAAAEKSKLSQQRLDAAVGDARATLKSFDAVLEPEDADSDHGYLLHEQLVQRLQADLIIRTLWTDASDVAEVPQEGLSGGHGAGHLVADCSPGGTRVVGCGHSDTPSFARAVTRYVAGAFFVPLRWLQRRAWVRRAAVILRPSGATSMGSTA